MSSKPRPTLQLTTIVERPLVEWSNGSILCVVRGTPPFQYEWHAPDGLAPQTSAVGDQIFGVAPGRYRVLVTDALGEYAEAHVDVDAVLSTPVSITEYRVAAASTSSSRDGSVEALGHGLEGCSLLWSNGVQTSGPVLSDVSCGTYAAVPLPRDGKVVTLVHHCAPAAVSVRGHRG